MNLLHWILAQLETHKDALIAIAALISPFTAVWLGLRTSKRQIAASLAINMNQLRGTISVAYRQKITDQIREVLVWHMSMLSDMAFAAQGKGDGGKLEKKYQQVTEQTHRLCLLSDASSSRLVQDFIVQFRVTFSHINAFPDGSLWTDAVHRCYADLQNQAGEVAMRILANELNRSIVP